MSLALLHLVVLIAAQNEPATIQPDIPVITLKHLGTIRLEVPVPEGPRWSILDYDLDDRGRIGVLERGSKDQPRLILMDSSGKEISEQALDLFRDTFDSGLHLRWIGRDTWLVIGPSRNRRSNKSFAWRIDTSSRHAVELTSYDCRRIQGVAADHHGGFLVYTEPPESESVPDPQGSEIIAYDSDCQVKWRHSLYPDKSWKRPLHADLTVTSDGWIVLLDQLDDDLVVFDAQGEYQATINSGILRGCSPSYHSLSSDHKGGVIIQGDGIRRVNVREALASIENQPVANSKHLGRMIGGTARPGLSSLRQTATRYPDGLAFHPRHRCAESPDGHIWCADYDRLLRLNESGLADKVLGTSLEFDLFPYRMRHFIDSHDRIYLMNSDFGNVRVFDNQGKQLHICRSRAGDFEKTGDFHLAVKPNGSVLIWQWYTQILSFSPSGERIGLSDLGLEQKPYDWILFQPRTGCMWIRQNNLKWLAAPDGRTMTWIAQRSDGVELSKIEHCAVAPDGSLALFDQSRVDQPDMSTALCTYGAGGSPLKTTQLASQKWTGPMAFNGRHVIYRGGIHSDFTLADLEKNALVRLEVDLNKDERFDATPYFANGGRELWMLRLSALLVERFEAPL